VQLHDEQARRQALEEELLRRETRFRALMECSSDCKMIIDPSGLVAYASPSTERLLGYEHDECRDQQAFAFLCPEELPRVRAAFSQLLQNPQPALAGEILVHTRDGSPRACHLTATNRLADPAVGGIVLNAYDITERKRAEAQVLQSAKLASLGLVAGGIAHELRNPLAIISANTELLTRCCDDPQLLKQCTRRVSAAVQRASAIIENMLNFASSRNESTAWVDLRAAFEDTLLLLQDHLTLQGIRARTHIPPGLPPILGNAQLLQLVFTNLILNACNAMPRGGALHVSMQLHECAWVEIVFRDHGDGMSPEQVAHLFDPFLTSVPNGKGTGLGLSVSHSIIEQHRGSIDVQSRLGKGTTFTIRLPVAATPA
jgi:PAS domain S-box-containing protein